MNPAHVVAVKSIKNAVGYEFENSRLRGDLGESPGLGRHQMRNEGAKRCRTASGR